MLRLTLIKAKRRLAVAWFAGAGLLFAIVLFLALGQSSPDAADDLWSWFLPAVMPNLSLIVGVLVSDHRPAAGQGQSADPFLFRLAMVLTAIYLVLLLLVPFAAPFSALGPAGFYGSTQVWLAPVQGLVSAAMGAFYVRPGKDPG